MTDDLDEQISIDAALYGQVSRMVALLTNAEKTVVQVIPRLPPGRIVAVGDVLQIAPDVQAAVMRHERRLAECETTPQENPCIFPH